jgi:hypothetical protein
MCQRLAYVLVIHIGSEAGPLGHEALYNMGTRHRGISIGNAFIYISWP